MVPNKRRLILRAWIILTAIPCLWGGRIQCAASSLFLTVQEQKYIETLEKKEKKIESRSLKLNAILYKNEKAWTVWINGRPFVRGEPAHNDWSIVTVGPRSVHVRLKTAHGIDHKTLMVGKGVTYEGAQPVVSVEQDMESIGPSS